MSAPLVDIGQKIQEIERIRQKQTELYSDMNRFTVQAILTYLHNSPMTVDQVFKFQERITKDITERQVVAILDDLVESGYAKKLGHRQYIHTDQSVALLEAEGITKDLLFPK